MTTIELQDYIHVYSMFSFRDGRKEAGIVVNKYNIQTTEVEYYFIPQLHMQTYKHAFETYDKEKCNRLAVKTKPDDILSVRPVSLEDYKMLMQLIGERNQLMNYRGI